MGSGSAVAACLALSPGADVERQPRQTVVWSWGDSHAMTGALETVGYCFLDGTHLSGCKSHFPKKKKKSTAIFALLLNFALHRTGWGVKLYAQQCQIDQNVVVLLAVMNVKMNIICLNALCILTLGRSILM